MPNLCENQNGIHAELLIQEVRPELKTPCVELRCQWDCEHVDNFGASDIHS